MSVKEKMTAIADAIRRLTTSTKSMKLDDMIADFADFTGYDISGIEGQTLNKKLTVMANIIRHMTGETKDLSLDDMAVKLNSEVKIGARWYETFEDALAAAQDGDAIALLTDVVLNETVVLEKSIAIEGNGHKIKTAFHNYMFDLKTASNGAFFKLVNIEVDHSHMVAHVGSGYLSNVTIENATFTGLNHLAYFRAGSGGNLNVKDVIAEDIGGTAICHLAGFGDVNIYGSTITAAGHAVQVEQLGFTYIENSTIKSTNKEFAIVYRPPDFGTLLTLNNSTVENISTEAGRRCGIWVPYGSSNISLYGNTSVVGGIGLLSAILPKFNEYSGDGFLVKYDNTCYNLYSTLDAAISKADQHVGATVYMVTEAARMAAWSAGCDVTLDSATGYYIVRR